MAQKCVFCTVNVHECVRVYLRCFAVSFDVCCLFLWYVVILLCLMLNLSCFCGESLKGCLFSISMIVTDCFQRCSLWLCHNILRPGSDFMSQSRLLILGHVMSTLTICNEAKQIQQQLFNSAAMTAMFVLRLLRNVMKNLCKLILFLLECCGDNVMW